MMADNPLVGDVSWLDIQVHENCGLYEFMVIEDENGDAINITGDTFEAHVRDSFDDTAALVLDISPSISDAAAGKILWSNTEAEIETVTTGDYVYDLKRTISGVPPVKILRGNFSKIASATT